MKQFSPPVLSIVVPCHNESEVLLETIRALNGILAEQIHAEKVAPESFLYFVDDGSTDDTWTIVASAHEHNKQVKGLKLANNAGQQNALLAGLLAVRKKVDCAITIDADLQDDVSAIEKMIDSHMLGNEIVYGVRQSRESDSFFKRNSALFFYRFMQLIGVKIVPNHSDFRLMSRTSLQSLSQFEESTLVLRGVIPLMGYQCDYISYDRKKRRGGRSKYPLRKMLSFAWDGICSFSVAPLRLISCIGALIFLLSIVMSFWVLFTKFSGRAVHGWASTLLPIYFLGGIQLLAIGIVGEYLGKVYLEVKRRPRFIKEVELE
jgi:glycosyltransferase involved in cell wall biosynthesis